MHIRIPGIPFLAHVDERLVPAKRELHLVFILDDLRRQARRRVERDVAVHDPDARVVGLEGDDEVAFVGQERHVAARRVDECEVGFGHVAFGHSVRHALVQNGKIVAVEVDGMLARDVDSGHFGDRVGK